MQMGINHSTSGTITCPIELEIGLAITDEILYMETRAWQLDQARSGVRSEDKGNTFESFFFYHKSGKC